MEVFGVTNIETVTNGTSPTHGLTENRVQTLKSLVMLLLNELKLLESLNPRRDDVFMHNHVSLSEEVEKFEIELIRAALVQAKGSQRVAARLLQTKTSTLCSKIKRYGIELHGVPLVSSSEPREPEFVSFKAF